MNEWDSIVRSKKSYGSSYGSCVHSVEKTTTHYDKHIIEEGETVQGISLKYGLSPAELRRVNKLYSSDSLYLRKFLLIPVTQPSTSTTVSNHEPATVAVNGDDSAKPETNHDDAASFLQKLDSQISASKKAFKDLKVDVPEEPSASPSGNTKFTKLTKQSFHKNHPKTVFSHSMSEDTDHLFQL
uniref:LysM and putative peptidoglycan-binding domain-containing protein 2-like n=1 Tax=Phallusia mammillata TaxID=59560 RepID=A0A6F9DJF2_9ASCI|nr:lysM and putative peptidoglycan-binding domain-containing protein 2-like [Phallusia mammillata]